MKGRTTMSDSSSYSSRQRARDDDYRRQYEQWVATLPEDERQKLEALGVDAPSLPGPVGRHPARCRHLLTRPVRGRVQ